MSHNLFYLASQNGKERLRGKGFNQICPQQGEGGRRGKQGGGKGDENEGGRGGKSKIKREGVREVVKQRVGGSYKSKKISIKQYKRE